MSVTDVDGLVTAATGTAALPNRCWLEFPNRIFSAPTRDLLEAIGVLYRHCPQNRTAFTAIMLRALGESDEARSSNAWERLVLKHRTPFAPTCSNAVDNGTVDGCVIFLVRMTPRSDNVEYCGANQTIGSSGGPRMLKWWKIGVC